MNELRVLIVDDEEPARRRLEELVERTHELQLIGVAGDGRAAIAAIRAERPDLVLLDVQMPGLSGLDVLTAVGSDAIPAVVFVTAYDRYAIEAFRRAAVDYLLKPFDDDRFWTSVKRARQRAAIESTTELVERLVDAISGGPLKGGERERIAVRDGDKIRLINVARVDFIQASGPYAEIHAGDSVFLHRERISSLEKRLARWGFCRIHRSTIVRLETISAIEPEVSGDCRVRLHSGRALKVSRSRVDTLYDRLGLT